MSKELTKKSSTEIVDFACLASETAKHAATVLRENLGSGGMSQSDLTRLKIPSGGGLSWTVPTLEGDQPEKVVHGIIVHFADVRSYWANTYTGEGTPPDCSSSNGLTGLGSPGGNCQDCPLNQFGSGTDAKGQPNNSKACKEGRLLFVLRAQDVIPIVVQLSTMSVKPSKKYFLGLAQAQVPYYGVVTELGLTTTKNQGGITYSQATFKAVRRLTDEEITQVRHTIKTMQAIFAKESVIEEDAVRG